MDKNPTERNKIDHLLPKNEDDALCQRIKPVQGPAFVAVTAPKGRASVISGGLFRLGLGLGLDAPRTAIQMAPQHKEIGPDTYISNSSS